MTPFPFIETSLQFDAEMRRIADANVWEAGYVAGLNYASDVIAGRVPQAVNPYLTTRPTPEPVGRCPACDDPECELNQP